MISTQTVTINVELDVEVEYEILSAATPPYFNRLAEQYYPGEAATIEIISVMITSDTFLHGDVLDSLPTHALMQIENQVHEDLRGENNYDTP